MLDTVYGHWWIKQPQSLLLWSFEYSRDNQIINHQTHFYLQTVTNSLTKIVLEIL